MKKKPVKKYQYGTETKKVVATDRRGGANLANAIIGDSDVRKKRQEERTERQKNRQEFKLAKLKENNSLLREQKKGGSVKKKKK